MKHITPYPDPEGKRVPRIRIDWHNHKIRIDVLGRIIVKNRELSPNESALSHSVGYSHGYMRGRFWVSKEPTHKRINEWCVADDPSTNSFTEVENFVKPITNLRMNGRSHEVVAVNGDEQAKTFSQPLPLGPNLVWSKDRLRGVLWIPQQIGQSGRAISTRASLLGNEFINEQGFWANDEYQYLGIEAMTSGNADALR